MLIGENVDYDDAEELIRQIVANGFDLSAKARIGDALEEAQIASVGNSVFRKILSLGPDALTSLTNTDFYEDGFGFVLEREPFGITLREGEKKYGLVDLVNESGSTVAQIAKELFPKIDFRPSILPEFGPWRLLHMRNLPEGILSKDSLYGNFPRSYFASISFDTWLKIVLSGGAPEVSFSTQRVVLKVPHAKVISSYGECYAGNVGKMPNIDLINARQASWSCLELCGSIAPSYYRNFPDSGDFA